ncbi:MAG TPA: flagellar hook-length control protein FliK [Desulfatiglandales bacterium]|nr:flagellar hook-length control protein FliK [Desulfatiglandales bacterium]
MNSMILQLASLTHQLMKDGGGTAVKSEKGGTEFLPIIQKSMSPHARKPLNHAKLDAQMESIGKDGRFYIESLRKALLAKGGSLQNLSLSTKDLPAIRKLLCQCGLSDEDIERFLQELLKDNPSRHISLTEFFDKVAELNLPNRELDRDIHLESSAIPYIEAALRDCGLTPKQLDPALSAAREKSGDLNLQRLANALKDLSSKVHADGTNQVNKLRLDRFVRELDDAINRIALGKGQALGDRITVGRDFVERMSHKLDNLGKDSHTGTAGEPRQGNQLPADISKTIEQIVESVGAAKKEDGPIPLVPPFSKVKVVDLHSGQRNTKGKNSNSTLSSLEGKEATKATNQNAQSLSLSGKNRMSSDVESGHVVESRPQDGQHQLRLEAGIKEAFSNASGASFSETASGVSENQRPAARGFLPGYLAEQVGRQIARSLLGGERVVRLQLKPPELGMVKVEMDIKEHVLKIGMITENSSVKELLLSNAHELRDALVEQGIKLERLDVQINYNSNQSLAHSKEDPGEEQKWIRDADGFIVPAPKGDEDSLTGPGTLALSHHVLDLII